MSDISKRVAARYIKAHQGEEPHDEALEHMGQQEQQAIPKSDTGKSMVKGMLEKAMEAFEKGDDAKFKSIITKISEHP
jgi:hypothetical protein